MRGSYEDFDELYDDVMDGGLDEMNVEERMAYIQMALDNACELLQRLVDCAADKLAEEKKQQAEKQDKEEQPAVFKIGKIGADMAACEEKAQQDYIAKIFGNA